MSYFAHAALDVLVAVLVGFPWFYGASILAVVVWNREVLKRRRVCNGCGQDLGSRWER